jgi:hypothetical protein
MNTVRFSLLFSLIAGIFFTGLSLNTDAADLLHQWTFNTDDGIEDIVGDVESVLRGDSTLSNDQLQIPASPADDGMEFDTGGDIDLSEINTDEDGVSFIVWCNPTDYSDQKFIFEIGTKSFLSLNANNNPYPRGGVGTASSTADEYSISLSSKPADGSGPIMLALTLYDKDDPNTDEAYIALYTGPATLFEAASSTTLEFVSDLGVGSDIKLLGDSTYGPFNITGSIDEFRIYGGVLTSGEIAAIAAEGPVIPEPANAILLGLAVLTFLRNRK